MEEKEAIRHAFFRRRKSIRAIARERGHARKTIRRAVLEEGPPRYRLTRERPSPVTGPVRETVRGWLEADAAAPKKQRHTARRIFRRLAEEQGFEGSEASVRGLVAALRKELTSREIAAGACIPLSYEPGEDAQADWAEAVVEIAGKPVVAHLFGMRPCFSGHTFVAAFPREDWPSVAEAHARAFEFFGGVFARIWYDNPKTLVGTILAGRERRLQPQFAALRSHYVFEAVFCNPGEAHEKGGIEGALGYARRNWLTPVPKFATWEDLNAHLEKCARRDAGRRREGHAETIAAMFEQERARLLAPPARRFEGSTLVAVRADRFSRVRIQGARYSVPPRFARANLLAKVFHDRVEVVSGERVVATHPRLERGEERLDPRHYLPLLERRPRALGHCRAMKGWRLPAEFEELRLRLVHRLGDSAGTRAYVRVLRLVEWHGEAAVADGIRRALAVDSISPEAVASMVGGEAPTLDLSSRPAIAGVEVAVPDLGRYDELARDEQSREVPA